MKKFLCFLLTFFMSLPFFQSTVYALKWSDESYNYLMDKGIVNEDIRLYLEEGDKPVTREAFFALCVSALFGRQQQTDKSLNFIDFKDCQSTLSGYISKAYEAGMLTGEYYNENLYIKPKDTLSRQDAASIIGRMLGISIDIDSEFLDNNKIAQYAKKYVSACQSFNIINGYEDKTFRPENTISCSESVKIIANIIKNGFLSRPKTTLLAGSSNKGAYNGDINLASFNSPSSVYVNNGIVYIADKNNNLIREIKEEKVSTFAGQIMGYDEYNNALGALYNSSNEKAMFNRPTAIIAISNIFFVLDSENNVIRQISNGIVKTYAGTGIPGYIDTKKQDAQFNNPQDFCIDDQGNFYIADTGNNLIRIIDKNGMVSTFAGKKGADGYSDGELLKAEFNRPSGIAYYMGALYVSDSGNNCIRKIKDGKVTTFAGASTNIFDDENNLIGYYKDGAAQEAYFYNPTDICIASDGTIYVADSGNGYVRKIKDDVVSTISGFKESANTAEDEKENLLKTALISPRGLFIENNILYICDSFKNIVVSVELK